MTIGIQLAAQYSPKIYDSDSLIKSAQVYGIKSLERTIFPLHLTDLVLIDSSYATKIIELEFKTGLWDKHIYNNNVTVSNNPDLTLELADKFGNKEAAKKLFEYYCDLPKCSKSDTIYYPFWSLDDYFKVLIRFYPTKLSQKLKEDFNDWSKIAQNSPKKRYPTIEEMQKISFEESMKFKTCDLIIDCNYILLQIAGALNYLKVPGFDNDFLEKLKLNQTYPFASKYSFPDPNLNASTKHFIRSKTIENSSEIKDFKKDYRKLEKIILDNFEKCCESRIYQIVEKGYKAHVTVHRNNGYDFYAVTQEPNNKLVIDLINFIIY